MEEAGCADIITAELLLRKLPPYLWKASKPGHIDFSSDFGAGIEKLVRCEDCIKEIGEDYWECVDDY